MAKIKQYPSQQDLLDLFDYNHVTGDLIYKTDRGSNKVKGCIAGCINKSNGYRITTINRNHYRTHRIIWIMNYGPIPDNLYIDHINGDRSDNRLENLRLATHSQNGQNQGKKPSNKTGYKGVSFNTRLKKYATNITVNNKQTHIGFYSTSEEAYQAYCQAAELYHLEYKNLG